MEGPVSVSAVSWGKVMDWSSSGQQPVVASQLNMIRAMHRLRADSIMQGGMEDLSTPYYAALIVLKDAQFEKMS